MQTQLVLHWMSPDVITITPNTLLMDAATIMREYDIRRLPIVDDDGNLAGIVTLGDIREALPSDTPLLGVWELDYILTRVKIKMFMTPNPITIYSNDTIAWAAGLMLEKKVSGLPVLDPIDDKLVGIITEADIFRLVAQTWQGVKSETVALT